ncbi:hypothetical protein HDU86_007411 [Geranomyces michiganensis]|nr:hypothetical protein HDU86_007411 [Geranomyces michiganensis]
MADATPSRPTVVNLQDDEARLSPTPDFPRTAGQGSPLGERGLDTPTQQSKPVASAQATPPLQDIPADAAVTVAGLRALKRPGSPLLINPLRHRPAALDFIDPHTGTAPAADLVFSEVEISEQERELA